MEDDDVAFAVLYGGSLMKDNDGTWGFANYKSRATSISKRCTKAELEDEIYECIELDRNKHQIRMKFIYEGCVQKVDPMEIRRDKDVKTYLALLRSSTIRPPLYVEVIAKVSVGPMGAGNRTFHGTGCAPANVSDQLSRTRPSFDVPPTVGDVCDNSQVPETHHHQGVFSKIVAPETWVRDHGPEHDGRNDVELDGDHDKDVHAEMNEDHEPEDDGDDVGLDDVELDGELQDNDKDVEAEDVYHAVSSKVYRTRWSDIISSKFTGNGGIEVGQLFNNKKELQSRVSIHCIRANKEFKVKRSTTARYEVECLEKTCKWRLRARKVKGVEIFYITCFDDVHTCTLEVVDRKHRNANTWIIGQYVKSKCEGMSPAYKPKEIQHDIEEQFGVKISYDKAWRIRRLIMSNQKVPPPKRTRGQAENAAHIVPN